MTFEEQLKKASASIRLRTDRKATIRGRLLQATESGEETIDGIFRERMEQRSIIFLLKRLRTMPIYAVILVIAFFGGGVSAAAQGSLPGNPLYRVKEFNQSARAALTFGAETRAGYEVKLAESKLREAAVLAAGGELNAELRELVEANFKVHADRVEARIDEFKAKENFNAAADVSAKFGTSLRVHEEILSKIAAQDGKNKVSDDETDKVVVEVRLRAAEQVKVREAIEGQIFSGVPPQASGNAEVADEITVSAYAKVRRTAALTAIRRAAEYIEEHRGKLALNAVENARLQLRLAKHTTEEGSASLKAGAYMEAVKKFDSAVAIADGVVGSLKTQLEIESRSNLPVDTVLPVPREPSEPEAREDASVIVKERTVIKLEADPFPLEIKVTPEPVSVNPEVKAEAGEEVEVEGKAEVQVNLDL